MNIDAANAQAVQSMISARPVLTSVTIPRTRLRNRNKASRLVRDQKPNSIPQSLRLKLRWNG